MTMFSLGSPLRFQFLEGFCIFSVCFNLVYFEFLLHAYERFACMYIYVPHAYLVPVEARTGYQMPWNWSYYGQLLATMRCWELNLGPLE